MNTITKASSLLAIAALGLAGAAQAGEPVQINVYGERQMLVEYDDLSVDSEKGRAKLERRIEAAAEKVCGANPGSRSLGMKSGERACMAKATSEARTAVLAKIEQRTSAARIAAAQ